MPAKSSKQKRFMDATAHNPAFAKKAGVPVSVAKDFSEKSKGIKFGGNKSRPDLQKVNEPKTRQGKSEFFNKGGDTMASKMNPGMMAMMAKKKDGMHKMPDGKMMKDSAHEDKKKDAPMMQKVAERAVKGHEKRMHTPKKMAHGGSVRGDGVAVRGKTRGRLV